MTYSILLVMLECLFVFGYSGLLVYYGLGQYLAREERWRQLSREMLPGITLALMLSLMLMAYHFLAHLMGWTTIWWPNAPAI